MTDAQTIALYDAEIASYAATLNWDTPDEDLKRFLKALPARADVLDLGCGPGHAAKLIAEAGHRVTATDASAGMAAYARRQPGITARQAVFEDHTEVAAYDGIYANFSLLHARLTDLPGHLKRLATTLKPGGVLHVSMKEGSGEQRDSLGRHYCYVILPDLQTLVSDAGFTCRSGEQGRLIGFDGVSTGYVVILAQKAPT